MSNATQMNAHTRAPMTPASNTDAHNAFAALGLRTEIVQALTECGYTTPTPIQAAAIPAVLEGHDLLAGAQTGTGKTAGFTLPLLQRLAAYDFARSNAKAKIRVLILTPTRELAAQVEESVITYSKYLDIKSNVVFGGVNINQQIQRLNRRVDILVATPGRLLDLMGQRCVDLSGIETLVLDEADRMLDMGFIHDIRRILTKLPAKRQNLFFSATFSDEIKTLANGILHNPVTVEVARRNTPAELIQQTIHPVDRDKKRKLLSHLFEQHGWKQVLIFARTKHGANRLAEQLETDGITAMAIHGNKSQNARTRALSEFKAGQIRALVATDIAARGIDIDALPVVVNYELPNVPEDYVHRIGRTGRAGMEGEAFSLVCVDENKLLADIEKLMKRKLPQSVITGFEPDRNATPQPLRQQRDTPPSRQRPAGQGQKRPARSGSQQQASGKTTHGGAAHKPSSPNQPAAARQHATAQPGTRQHAPARHAPAHAGNQQNTGSSQQPRATNRPANPSGNNARPDAHRSNTATHARPATQRPASTQARDVTRPDTPRPKPRNGR